MCHGRRVLLYAQGSTQMGANLYVDGHSRQVLVNVRDNTRAGVVPKRGATMRLCAYIPRA